MSFGFDAEQKGMIEKRTKHGKKETGISRLSRCTDRCTFARLLWGPVHCIKIAVFFQSWLKKRYNLSRSKTPVITGDLLFLALFWFHDRAKYIMRIMKLSN